MPFISLDFFTLTPQFPYSSVNLSLPSPSISTNQLSLAIFATLSGLSDDLLNLVAANEIRYMLSARRDFLPTNSFYNIVFFEPFHFKFLNHDSSNHFDPKNEYGTLLFFY